MPHEYVKISSRLIVGIYFKRASADLHGNSRVISATTTEYIYILSYDEKIGHIVIGQQICSQHNGSNLKHLFFTLSFEAACIFKKFPEYVYSQRYSVS
jgi:hypothetical protein